MEDFISWETGEDEEEVKQNQSDAYGEIMQIVSDTKKEFAEERKDEN